jgi:2-dehydro-3-deoxyglucarate aldolase/4-hydroxy-2-oxoheptanedioate aldolase
MISNPAKRKLQAGDLLLGTFLFEFNSPGIMQIAGAAGAEFVLCDMEHSGWSFATIRRLTASAPPGVAPLVRVPAAEYHFIARALDMGALGIMAPLVETVDQVEQIVAAAKYPPRGRRGAAFGMPHDGYQPGDLHEKIDAANDATLVIVQIETRTGLDNVEQIAGIDGVDVLWIGQTDLTCSLGIPGRFDHPDFVAAVDRVVNACRDAGKVAGFMPLSLEEGRQFRDRGFRMLAYSGDLWIYQQALRCALEGLRHPE